MRTNQAAVATLPQVKQQWVTAHLVEYKLDKKAEKNPVWSFQFNPQSLRYGAAAKYTESGTMSVREPDLQFGSTEAETLEIPEIYLDTYAQGRSLQPLLDGIRELLKADLKNGQFAPKVLSFVWGHKRFGPCVLNSAPWEETAWVAGAPARVKLSLKLTRVPPPDQLGQQPIAPEPDAKQREADGSPRKDLTDRQRKDASDAAKAWLKANQSTQSPKVSTAVKSNAYKLSTDKATGDVTMLDGKGGTIGIVGRWNGKEFATDKATLPKP
jgi:hypothetical protein